MSLSKPLPTFSHMPWNVQKDIVNFTDPLTKLSLFDCSKKCRYLVGSFKPHFDFIELELDVGRRSISVEFLLPGETKLERKTEFFACPDGFSKQTTHGSRQSPKNMIKSKDQNYIDAAVSELCNLIRGSSVTVKTLKIHTVTPYGDAFRYESMKRSVLRKLQSFLRSLPHRLNVFRFHMAFSGTQEDILQALPYIKPGTLECLTIQQIQSPILRETPYEKLNLSKVCELEQWKRTQKLCLRHFDVKLPVEKWSQIPESEVHFNELSLATLKKVVQLFSDSQACRSTTLFSLWFDRETFEQYLSKLERIPSDDRTNQWKVPIRDSTDYIRITLTIRSRIKVERRC